MFVAILASPTFAWNALGHKVVAEIAWQQLEPEERQRISDTIRRHPRFPDDFAKQMPSDVAGDKATEDHWIFQHAGTWPDIARGSEHDRPTWHYINLPLYLNTSDRMAIELTANLSTEYPGGIPRDQYNVLQAIQHCQAAIHSRAGLDVKAVAYCWLFHLVGDLHQPLHSVALFSVDQFPQGDRGGNAILLVRGQNLHSLWDNLLGRQHYLRNVDKEVAELAGRNRDVWDFAANEIDPRKWAEESHKLAESFAYDDAILKAVRTVPPGAKLAPFDLPESYYKAAGEHARRRIIAAGLRLAAILQH